MRPFSAQVGNPRSNSSKQIKHQVFQFQQSPQMGEFGKIEKKELNKVETETSREVNHGLRQMTDAMRPKSAAPSSVNFIKISKPQAVIRQDK